MRLTRFLSAYLNAATQGWFTPKRSISGLGEVIRIRPEITYNNDRKDRSGKKLPDGIEIRFGDNVPTKDVRERLKAAGFQFSEKQLMWYAYDNADTKVFVEAFATDELEVIPLREGYDGEKNWFWAKVRNEKEWDTIPAMAPIKADGITYTNKAQFLSSGKSWMSLMNQGKLYFKKFFQKKDAGNTTAPVPSGPSPSRPTATPSNPDQEISDKLRNLGLGMEISIQSKLNPPIAQQRKTKRRVTIASGMREEGLQLLKVQQSLYALADAYQYGTPMTDLLRKFRTKLDLEALVTGYDGVLSNPNYPWQVPSRLLPLGINTMEDWKQVYEELDALVNQNKQHQPQILTEIQKLQAEVDSETDKLVGQRLPGFFPTPKSLIGRLLSTANLKEGLTILEPCSGKGDIVFHLMEEFPYRSAFTGLRIWSVEYQNPLYGLQLQRASLYALKYQHEPSKYSIRPEALNIWGIDFAEFVKQNPSLKFDRIIMNPPFEKGQDIDFVLKAYELLEPNGILVALMSEGSFYRSYKRDKAFQEWVSQMEANNAAVLSEPIRGAFSTAQSFVQTGVTVRILKLERKAAFYNNLPSIPGYSPAEASSIQEPEPSSRNPNPASSEEEEVALVRVRAQMEIELMKIRNELKRKKNLANVAGLGRPSLTTIKQSLKILRI